MTDDIDVAELEAWAAGLAEIHARIAPRFARSEPRARVAAYVRGLLAPLERKNGWTLAERAGEASPDGMQRLLASADWDRRRGPRRPARLRGRAPGGSGRGAGGRRDRVSQEGEPVRGGGPPVLGHRRADRE